MGDEGRPVVVLDTVANHDGIDFRWVLNRAVLRMLCCGALFMVPPGGAGSVSHGI